MYHEDRMPSTAEDWDKCEFVDKNYVGWNVFSKTTAVYVGAEKPQKCVITLALLPVLFVE